MGAIGDSIPGKEPSCSDPRRFALHERMPGRTYNVDMTVPAEVLDAVLGLPEDVQDELVRELAARRQGGSRTDPAWDAEISNRVDDILSGRVETIPLSEIKAELAARRANMGHDG